MGCCLFADVQIGLNSLLICFEMFIAAIAHRYAFPHETYVDGSLKLLMEERAQVWNSKYVVYINDILTRSILSLSQMAAEHVQSSFSLNNQAALKHFELSHSYDFTYPLDEHGIYCWLYLFSCIFESLHVAILIPRCRVISSLIVELCLFSPKWFTYLSFYRPYIFLSVMHCFCDQIYT